MENAVHLSRRIIVICAVVILWTALFMWLGRHYNSRDWWAVMLIGAALFTLFGILGLPGSVDENGAFRESRIRLAISATLIVAYLVYFGSAAYLEPGQTQEGKPVTTFGENLLPTLTNMLTVTISFYFGSTAAVEIAGKLRKKDGSKTEG